MILCKHFRLYIIQPVLKATHLWCPDSEELLIATMAHESLGGKFLVQENKKGQRVMKGGVGVYQMQPATYQTVINKYSQRIDNRLFPGVDTESADMMIDDLSFATLVARLNYLRFPEPLPKADNIEGIFSYYKRFWNTMEGKATREDFLRNYSNYTGRKL